MPTQEESLKALGFTIEPVKQKADTQSGWVYRVRGTAPTFYIRKTRSGRLLAFRNREDKIETTINGLASFKEANGDLVGSRYMPKNGPKMVEKKKTQSNDKVAA